MAQDALVPTKMRGHCTLARHAVEHRRARVETLDHILLIRLRCLADRNAVALAVARAADELHVAGVDFEREARLALFVRPLFNMQPPFDIDAAALRQVLRDRLRALAPDGHAKPSGYILLL